MYIFFRYHPFYITDSPEGGLGQRNENEIRAEKVYAGVVYDSDDYPVPMEGASEYLRYFFNIFFTKFYSNRCEIPLLCILRNFRVIHS